MSFRVVAFYRFVKIEDPQLLRSHLRQLCHLQTIRGVMLVSSEGLNATMAGTESAIEVLLDYLDSDARFSGMRIKEARSDTNPFNRLRVRLKKEIVTLGIEGIDPTIEVGTYVSPDAWNELIESPDVTVVDVRNDYEIEVGSFFGAINPKTDTFRAFPTWVDANLDPKKTTKIALFCTGGIRCEKATSYLKNKGFDAVYHLEGGILQYMQDVPQASSLWHGECFVFDRRVSVNHQLEPGHTQVCHSCSYPISEAEKSSPYYQHGVSCSRCHDTLTEDQRERFSQRQLQIELAEKRNERHLGMPQRLPKQHPLKGLKNST